VVSRAPAPPPAACRRRSRSTTCSSPRRNDFGSAVATHTATSAWLRARWSTLLKKVRVVSGRIAPQELSVSPLRRRRRAPPAAYRAVTANSTALDSEAYLRDRIADHPINVFRTATLEHRLARPCAPPPDIRSVKSKNPRPSKRRLRPPRTAWSAKRSLQIELRKDQLIVAV